MGSEDINHHHRSVVAAMKAINARVCVYTPPDKEELASMCDCKYGVTQETVGNLTEDGPGCPEMRSVIRCIEAMTPEEFDHFFTKPSGFFGTWDALDIEQRKHKHTKDLLVEAHAQLSKMRKALRAIETRAHESIGLTVTTIAVALERIRDMAREVQR